MTKFRTDRVLVERSGGLVLAVDALAGPGFVHHGNGRHGWLLWSAIDHHPPSIRILYIVTF